jgi:hypothetical protein
MHPEYTDRFKAAADKAKTALAAAKNEKEVNDAQNDFNNTLNQIKADAKARPEGTPKRNSPSKAPDTSPGQPG